MRKGFSALLAAGLAVSMLGAFPSVGLAAAPTAAPAIVSPTDGSSVAANPVLSWAAVPGAVKYRVQVSATSGFASNLYSVDTTALRATPPTQLPFGQLWWRVAGLDSGSALGPYSTASFTLLSGAAPVQVSPTNGQVLNFPTDPVIFTWQPVSGATSYKVQVGTSPGLVGATQYTTSNTSYAMTDTQAFILPDGTAPQSWYWSVQATFASSQVSAWSTPWSYQITWSATPQLRSPSNGAMGVTEVVFSWDPVPGAATYEIQVSPNGDWQNNKIVDQTVDSTRYSPYPTLDNQSYYWRVRARAAGTANNMGQWSSEFVFSRSWPTRPVTVSPHWTSGSSTPVVSSMRLSWTPAAASGPGWVDHADHYQVEISTDLNFASGNMDCFTNHTTYTPYSNVLTTGEPGSCSVPISLQAGVTYYWRVRGIDSSKGVLGLWDMTSSDDTQRFIYLPELPDLSCGPADGASVATPLLCWSAVSGGTQYRVTINKSGGAQALQDTTWATTFTPLTALNPADGPFSWHVEAMDANNNWGPYAVARTFSLIAPTTSTSLTLFTPSAGAAAIRMPSMTWQPYTGAAYYKVFKGTNSDPIFWDVAPMSGADRLPYAAFTSTDPPLASNSYLWYVQAFDASDNLLATSNQISPPSFSIGTQPDYGHWTLPYSSYQSPECPVVTNPAIGRCIPPDLGDTQELKWVPDPQAGAYQIWVAKDKDFTNIYRKYKTNSTTFTPRESWLDSQAGESYYWFIQPCVDAALQHCGPAPDTLDGLYNASAYRKVSPGVTGLSTSSASNPPVTSSNIADQITFNWSDYITTSQAVVYPVSGATSSKVTQEAKEYLITVATAADFNSSSLLESNVKVDQTQYTPWSITYPEGPLWWRVQAVDGSGNPLTMSATGTVTKASAPISLVSPAAGATVSGVPYLTWTPQNWAAKYTVEVYKNGDTLFSPSNKVLSQTTPIAAWAPTSNLPAGDYAWRVQRLDQSSRPGPWSSGRVFTLRPSAPTLSTPADLAALDGSNLLFTWTGVANASSYKFQTSSTSDFAAAKENQATVMTAWSPTSAYAVGTYYWRVAVLDAAGNTLNTSGYRTFSVSSPVVSDLGTYYPITPVRMLDTRYNNGLSGKLYAGTPRTFSVAGRNGVPSGAKAVTGNVTVVNSTNSWAVFLGPDPTPSPTTSTINFSKGEITANGLTVALSSTGTLSATYMSTTGNTTDLVFDVTGYFASDNNGSTYHPMTPARLLDTRSGNGWSAKLDANTPVTFAVAGRGGVPADATAVTGNVTVVNATNAWAIFVGPTPSASPTTSTLNFNAGDVKANSLTVALSGTGTLSATYMSTAGNKTDLVFDVTGYYTHDTSGSRFVPLTPVRLLDTRYSNGLSGKLYASVPRSFQVSGRGGIPSTATAVTGNVTIVNQTNSWAIFVGPDPVASPSTSTLNFNIGDVKSNGLTVALGSTGTLSATYLSTAGNSTDLVFDATGYFLP